MNLWHALRLRTPPGWRVAFRRARARLFDPFDHGVASVVSGQPVRVPAYFRGGGLADYENTAVARFVEWLDAHPGAEVIDCGCSLSTYGLIALCRSRTAAVVGIDPGLVGLKCTRWYCSKVPAPERLRLVQGFLGPYQASPGTLAVAEAATARALADPAVSAMPEAIRYSEAASAAAAAVPHYALDGLLADATRDRLRLLKIDVEGHELAVLRGATATLRRLRPHLLLSAHPQFYGVLGTSMAELQALLSEHDYTAALLATDHEEHWWCEPA